MLLLGIDVDRREELGRLIPSEGSDSDLRRVLYGIIVRGREEKERE